MTPAPVVDGVVTTASGAADVAIAANGSLVYVRGRAGGGAQQTVVSVDRAGPCLTAAGPSDLTRTVTFACRRRRAARTRTQESDVWTYDLARATLSRLTTDPA